MSKVFLTVIFINQAIILFVGRGNFEAVELSNVGHSQQLRPYRLRIVSHSCRSKRHQVGFSICFPHLFDGGLVGPLWHILGPLDGVEIRQQRNCDPVQFPNTVVAADHYTCFTWLATTQQCRRFSAYVIKVNRRMTCWGKAAKEPVWLLDN